MTKPRLMRPQPSKGAPPSREEAIADAEDRGEKPDRRRRRSAETYANLNFEVPLSFKRQFKSKAAAHDKPMVDVLVEAFELWLERNET